LGVFGGKARLGGTCGRITRDSQYRAARENITSGGKFLAGEKAGGQGRKKDSTSLPDQSICREKNLEVGQELRK